MSRTLPPLHLFSIFEAAARNQSFKKASEELFITPSAISHQIKTLEEFLGFELFLRKNRSVRLNSAGKLYLEFVQKSLENLELGTKKVRSTFASPVLKISTFSTLASHVIIPQLPYFQKAHPDVDIRIETRSDTVDMRYEEVDLAIRLGAGKWPGVAKRKLLDLEIGVVCSPKFASQNPHLSLEHLSQFPLIDLSDFHNPWEQFLSPLGIKNMPDEFSLSFSSYDATLLAAEEGLGLALAIFPLEQVLIKKGLLVSPIQDRVTYPLSIYAVYREEDKDRHDIQCFLDWLIKSPLLSINE